LCVTARPSGVCLPSICGAFAAAGARFAPGPEEIPGPEDTPRPGPEETPGPAETARPGPDEAPGPEGGATLTGSEVVGKLIPSSSSPSSAISESTWLKVLRVAQHAHHFTVTSTRHACEWVSSSKVQRTLGACKSAKQYSDVAISQRKRARGVSRWPVITAVRSWPCNFCWRELLLAKLR
jgi:hypothetical protein